MRIEIVYNSITEFISSAINRAQKSVVIALPYFDNIDILRTLIIRTKNKCDVHIIVADCNENQKFFGDYNRIQFGQPTLHRIPLSEAHILTDPVCVIDDHIVLNGSFSCYKKYSDEDDFLVVNFENPALNAEFRKNIEQLYAIEKEHLQLLNEPTNEDAAEGLQLWEHSRVDALKLQLSNYQNQYRAMDIEKLELNKVLVDFNHQHTLELGDIIMDILELKTEKLKHDKEAMNEALNDKDAYEENYNAERNKDIIDINEDDKLALKKLFREATMLCHPDKFSNANQEIQEQAEDIFKALNEGNARNDIDIVKELLKRLKTGFLNIDDLVAKNSVDFYQGKIKIFKDKLSIIINEVFAIKNSETYLTITEIEDWNSYFRAMKASLQEELETLQRM